MKINVNVEMSLCGWEDEEDGEDGDDGEDGEDADHDLAELQCAVLGAGGP